MHTRPGRSRVRLATRSLWIVALLAVFLGCTTAMASGSSTLSLSGTWAGKYKGAYSGTFRLHWTQSGSLLRGSITLSNPKGKYAINGAVRGSAIKFGAVGAGATYTGSVSGTTMSGRYKSVTGGGTWSAHKCKSRTVC